MNEMIKKNILEKIKRYDCIIIGRHFRPDGDAIGSTKGLQEILKTTFPQKQIYVVNEDSSEYLSFLGDEDRISDELYENALGIVIDTATADRLSNKKILGVKELVKIDHHVDVKPYGDISWVEDWRSSACEMIVDFYDTFKNELKLTSQAALYLYTGMVTDSGRFKFDSVTGETLRLAGILLDKGIDTQTLFARLYLEDYDYLKFKAHVYKKMKITENGVVYLHVTKKMQEQFGLSLEQASNAVTCMEAIKNCLVWIAFIDAPENIRVRLRSRFVTINKLGEKYRGGGHEKAAGATVYSTKEMSALVKDADRLVKEYKENHEGWL